MQFLLFLILNTKNIDKLNIFNIYKLNIYIFLGNSLLKIPKILEIFIILYNFSNKILHLIGEYKIKIKKKIINFPSSPYIWKMRIIEWIEIFIFFGENLHYI